MRQNQVLLRFAFVMTIGALGTLCVACEHTFIYRPDQFAGVAHGEVQVPHPRRVNKVNSYPIKRVMVERRAAMGAFGPITSQEALALAKGQPVNVEAVRIDVSTTGTIWREYGLWGALAGVILGGALGYGISSTIDEGVPALQIVPLVAFAGTFYGTIGGVVWGSIAESGTTDYRLEADAPTTVLPDEERAW